MHIPKRIVLGGAINTECCVNAIDVRKKHSTFKTQYAMFKL